MIARRWLIAVLTVSSVLSLASNGLSAQEDTLRVVPDSALPDSATTAADTLPPATVPLRPAEVPEGPLPPGTRYVFTRDSILWASAITLADLLTSIPGVYLARGGYVGEPEYVMYAGRGPSSIEMHWDGFELFPTGGDSVYLDVGRWPLAYLRQVDVVVTPSLLRVYVVSERHSRIESRSALRVMSGDLSFAEYAGLFQKRWASGFGLNLAGDFLESNLVRDGTEEASRFDLWGKLEWIPNQRSGVVYQIRRGDRERQALTSSAGLGPPARKGARTDSFFSVFTGTRDDGFGIRLEAGLGSTSWSNDSAATDSVPDQTIRQAYALIRYSRPNFSGAVRGRVGDDRFGAGVDAEIGWVPVQGIVLSGKSVTMTHPGGRTSQGAEGSFGVYAGPFSVVAVGSRYDRVQAPSLGFETAQRTSDASVTFGVSTSRLSGHVGLARRDAFIPLAPPEFPDISGFDISQAATYRVADLSFRPVHPVIINAWYSDPTSVSADLQPPKHGRVDLLFRSRFLRRFRSEAFDFKVKYGVEFWSSGTAGFDQNGNRVALPGATFHEIFLQLQLVDFRIFWNLRNSRNTTAEFVPGLPYPKNVQTFGVKWEFIN